MEEGRKYKVEPYELLTKHTFPLGKLHAEAHHVRRPDGKEIILPKIPMGLAVIVVPLTERQEIVLARQWRQAIDDFTLETPGGAIEPGEVAEAAARRELAEEVGMVADTVEPLVPLRVGPSILDLQVFYFLARGCRPEAGLRVDEPTEAVVMPIETALKEIGHQIGTIETALSIMLASARLDAS